MAKHAAAEAALRSFVQFKNAPEAQIAMNVHIKDIDFTSDVTEAEPSLFNAFQPEVNSKLEGSNHLGLGTNGSSSPSVHLLGGKGIGLTQNSANQNSRKPVKMPIFPGEKSPVMLLNELRPGIRYDCISETGEQYSKFTMSVTIDNESFEGTGPSKKLGKAAAAKAALAKLYNVSFSPFSLPACGKGGGSPRSSIVGLDRLALPQVLADHIARLVITKFTSLTEGEPTHSRRKVLAGIVMTTGPQMDDARVISVATGTKCINGEHMSVRGASLNDTHAEIVARRCLCDFLYQQLELHTSPG